MHTTPRTHTNTHRESLSFSKTQSLLPKQYAFEFIEMKNLSHYFSMSERVKSNDACFFHFKHRNLVAVVWGLCIFMCSHRQYHTYDDLNLPVGIIADTINTTHHSSNNALQFDETIRYANTTQRQFDDVKATTTKKQNIMYYKPIPWWTVVLCEN